MDGSTIVFVIILVVAVIGIATLISIIVSGKRGKANGRRRSSSRYNGHRGSHREGIWSRLADYADFGDSDSGGGFGGDSGGSD